MYNINHKVMWLRIVYAKLIKKKLIICHLIFLLYCELNFLTQLINKVLLPCRLNLTFGNQTIYNRDQSLQLPDTTRASFGPQVTNPQLIVTGMQKNNGYSKFKGIEFPCNPLTVNWRRYDVVILRDRIGAYAEFTIHFIGRLVLLRFYI